ncbi:MAG TPA: cyclopropane-fatty-acyl-phospholipid synthase family protein [Gammaproteobacteria bacterium]
MKNEKSGFLGIPLSERGLLLGQEAEGAGGRVWAIERWLIAKLLQKLGNPSIAVRYWDGSLHEERYHPVMVTLKDRGALWRLFTNPFLNFGDDYSVGRIEVEGGLYNFLEAFYLAQLSGPDVHWQDDTLLGRLLRWQSSTLSACRNNIHHHYDLGNDFYRLWLDEEMAYTCAYFPHAEATLEQAQSAKLDHVCRKLQLKPGETVVEAGCGWGGLARHMARHYGVKVRAFNISKEQIAYARERAKREGLDDRIEYVEDDYRNISGQYDAFVSVGMLEHVGVERYRTLGEVVARSLVPHGRGLIHSIGQNQAKPVSEWTQRRIFPGGYPPTLREMMEIFEPQGLSVLDVENLRLHYAKTLEHWLQRFEHHLESITSMYDESFVRAWRLYLAASQANFSAGTLQLFQVLFAMPGKNDIAWTRAHLYQPPGEV